MFRLFNNDINGYAVHDAERLRILVDGAPAIRGRATPLATPAPRNASGSNVAC